MPDDDQSRDPLLRDFQRQARVQNAEYWAMCEANGVTAETLLRVRGRFATWDDEDVAPMQRILETELGYAVEVGREPDGSGGQPWVLTCVLPVGPWTLAAIDRWTDAMVEAAAPVPGTVFMDWNAATVRLAPQVEQLQRAERRMNVETWRRLQAHGVLPTTVLNPEANFWAPSRASADALAAALRDLGYTVRTDVAKRGLLRRKQLWSVVGVAPATTLNPDAIDAWTDDMVDLAVRHGAELDGWGTFLPD